MSANSCEVGLNTNECENPPESQGEPIRTTCFSCGKRACRGCSRLRSWLGRRCRICNDCAEEYQP